MSAPRNVRLLPLSTLKRWERNYRIGNVEAIAASIKRFGFNGALRVWQNGIVMAGNHSLAALQFLKARGDEPPVGVIDGGDWQVPCIDVSHLSDVEAQAFAIADNRTAQLATDDEERLGAILTELIAIDRDLVQAAGFQDAALEKLLLQARTDVAEVPEPEDPNSDDFGEIRPKLGEVWTVGKHKILCGDATNASDVQELVSVVDLIVTDPPYGINYEGKTKAKLRIQNDGRNERQIRVLVADLLRAVPLKPGGAFYVFSAAGPGELAFRLGIADAGYRLRQALVWVKQTFVLGHSDFHYRHESVLYGWQDGAGHYSCGDRTLDTVLEYPKPTRSDLHPTMKPVEMIEFLINNSSRTGETVYDCCLGSGTTLLAAERTGRVCAGVEIDPRYCEVTLRRWEQMTNERAARAA